MSSNQPSEFKLSEVPKDRKNQGKSEEKPASKAGMREVAAREYYYQSQRQQREDMQQLSKQSKDARQEVRRKPVPQSGIDRLNQHRKLQEGAIPLPPQMRHRSEEGRPAAVDKSLQRLQYTKDLHAGKAGPLPPESAEVHGAPKTVESETATTSMGVESLRFALGQATKQEKIDELGLREGTQNFIRDPAYQKDYEQWKEEKRNEILNE